MSVDSTGNWIINQTKILYYSAFSSFVCKKVALVNGLYFRFLSYLLEPDLFVPVDLLLYWLTMHKVYYHKVVVIFLTIDLLRQLL